MADTATKRQPELAGFERPSIDALDKASLKYIDLRDKRIKATAKEKDAKEILRQALQEHKDQLEKNEEGMPVYVFRDGTMEHTAFLEASDIKPKVLSRDLDKEVA